MEPVAHTVFEIGFVLLLAAMAGWVARRLGLPAVLGYLATGLAVSPFTPGYVVDRHELEVLANVGVVLLLFEVGIQIDPLRLGRERRRLLLIAPVQVLVTAALAAAATRWVGLPATGALLAGICVAMSSSVVVVNITRSRRRTTDRATDEVLLGWSVLQDMVGVIAALALIVLSGLQARSGWAAFLLAAAFITLAIASAFAVSWILRSLHAEHDLFLIVSVASGLVLAGLGSFVFGVPLALAAFIAGLAITESPQSAEARRRLLPFRDVFAVLFFVAIGALVDPYSLPSALPWLAFLLILVVITKVLVVYGLATLARLPERRWQIAIGLGQIGEFSFVLAAIGLGAGIIPRSFFTGIVSAVILTIAASTVLVRLLFPKATAA
ncbi:MAG: cation:proton antiporter [Candidatus Dormibacter sp.]